MVNQISKFLRRRSVETYLLYAIAIVTSVLIIRFVDEPTTGIFSSDTSHNVSIDGAGYSGWFRPGGLFSAPWQASTSVHAYMLDRLARTCYVPVTPLYNQGKLMKVSELQARGCEQRIPQAIIAGARKCGSESLYKFLKIHPEIVGPSRENGFLATMPTGNTSGAYRDQMPYSTKAQVTMDIDQDAFHTPHAAPQIVAQIFSTDVKLIFVLCDPVERALADYVSVWRVKEAELIKNSKAKATIQFQASVLDKMHTYKISEHNEFVDASVYIQHAVKWLQVFPLTNILFVDGDVLKSNPIDEIRKVEDFLKVRSFFLKGHFFFNDQRGCSCIQYPMKACPPLDPVHPVLEKYAIERICEALKPYNDGLARLLNRRFSWMNNC